MPNKSPNLSLQEPHTETELSNFWTTKVEKLMGLFLVFLALIIGCRLRYCSHAFVGDDAFMTFRVVNNLLYHGEFCYNLGERVYSSTTPLFVLILAFFSAVLQLEVIDFYLPLVCFLDLLNICLLAILGKKATRSWIGAAAASWLYALSWKSVTSNMMGMEASLFVFLILTSTTCAGSAKNKKATCAAAILAALAAITRPEGVLFSGSLLVYLFWVHRKLPFREIACLSVVLIPWISFAFWYFGTIIPHAAIAKDLGYNRLFGNAAVNLFGHFFELAIPLNPPNLISIFIGCLLMALGVTYCLKNAPESSILVAFNGLFLLLYLVKDPFLFDWYYVPLEPGYVLIISSGLLSFGAMISNSANLKIQLCINIFLFCLLLPLLNQYILPYFDEGLGKPLTVFIDNDGDADSTPKPYISPKDREYAYAKIAELLKPEVKNTTVILAPEFGTLGYYLPAKMLSTIGHVNPEMLRYLILPRSALDQYNFATAVTEEMVKGKCPDFIVSHDTFFRNTLSNSNWFNESYSLYYQISTGIWGSSGVYVFKKKFCIPMDPVSYGAFTPE